MYLRNLIITALAAARALAQDDGPYAIEVPLTRFAPKVFIISMFTPEAAVWHNIAAFDLLAHNYTLPGLSPLFPSVHCVADHTICQLVTGEGEINAAATVTSVLLSPLFDLRRTYFLIAGIAGVNPHTATIAAATLSRYEVQVALQYEFDSRDLPSNFSTGYFAQGSFGPGQYPTSIYGTEVFELSTALRRRAIGLVRAANVTLADDEASREYRARYSDAAATVAPGVLECDGATSDTYFSGTRLTQAFENYTALVTNGTGRFCASGQEDSATFEALVRADAAGRADFTRVMALRTASDFTAPPPGVSNYQNLEFGPASTFDVAVENLKVVGLPIIQGIIKGWNETFAKGIEQENYVGDILGTLNSTFTRDFGLPSAMEKRGGAENSVLEFGAMGLRRRRMGNSQKSALLPKMRIA